MSRRKLRDTRDKLLIREWNAGVTAAEIGHRLDMTRGAVTARIVLLRKFGVRLRCGRGRKAEA